MNVLTRLRLGKGLSAAERSLAEAILSNPDALLAEGAKQLARRASVSQATVYRLCEKLGCSGLADLKVQVSGSLEAFRQEQAGVDVNFPVGPGQGGAQVIAGIERDFAQTLAATANVLDPKALDRAAAIVGAAERVILLATAGNSAFAQSFRFQMAEIGRAVSAPVDEYEQRLAVASAGERDAVVLVSFGGRGFISRPSARQLAGRGVPVALVASAGGRLRRQPRAATGVLRAHRRGRGLRRRAVAPGLNAPSRVRRAASRTPRPNPTRSDAAWPRPSRTCTRPQSPAP